MEINDALPRCGLLIKELSEGLNHGKSSLEQIEQHILSFLYELGQSLEQQVLARGLPELGIVLPVPS